MIRRRDSLRATLDEIEGGILQGVEVVVVNRGWWDELSGAERSALRERCERCHITLSADDRLSRHFVELGDGPAPPALSSERRV